MFARVSRRGAILALLPVVVACSADEGPTTSTAASGGDASSPATPTASPSGGIDPAPLPGLYVLELATGAVEPLAGPPPEGAALAPAVSPDGTRIAFDAEVDGSRQIWVMNVDGTGLEPVTDDIEATSPTWSPDGLQIAYIGFADGGTRAVVVLDLASGASERVSSEQDDVYGADWSTDGREIVYQVPRGDGFELRSVDLRSGETLTLCCPRDDSIASDADWSPDGNLLVFGYSTPEDNFALYTMKPSGDAVAAVEPADPSRYHGHPVWSPDGTKIAYQGAPGVWVLDLVTGEDRMLEPEMWGPAWLDEDTLIVELPPDG